MDQAVAEFTWDEAERATALRRYGFLRTFALCMVLGAVGFFGSGILLVVLGKPAGWLLCAAGVVYIGYSMVAVRTIPRRLWENTPGIQDPRRVVFSGEGVTTRTKGTAHSETWERYKCVSERDGWYLFGRTRLIAAEFVPRRAFASPRDEAMFRSIARLHARESLVANSLLDDDSLFEPPTLPD
ncbi:MAG: hypothetical protein ABR925_02575 [Acidimicrobiales bacterium]